MHRGYCGIGIFNAKHEVNCGTLFRSAVCFSADFIFTVGQRYKIQASDTVRSYRHLPYYNFISFEDFYEHMPYDCQLVGVEIVPNARSLETFVHPERAIYILGAEDHGLPQRVLDKCCHIIRFESAHCTNVSIAGSIVLYDRQAKQIINERILR